MRSAVALVLLLVVAGCESSSPSATRRNEFLEAHPETAADVRQAILGGEIILGMTYPEVVASIGPYDSAGPDVSDLGDYWVRLYGPRALVLHGPEIEESVLVFTERWGDDPLFRRVKGRIRAHRARTGEGGS